VKILKDNTSAFARKLKELNKKALRVGIFENAKYQNGDSVAQVASDNEFGTLKIPARPFFTPAVNQNGQKWLSVMTKEIDKSIRNDSDINVGLNRVGLLAQGDIQKSLVAVTSPALAPATIAKKGSSKPLVDTGILLSSITYAVVDK
jgi:hypothetical protein